MTETSQLTSLINEAPTGIDARTAFAHLNHGDSWRLRRLGAHDLLHDERAGYVQFDFNLTRKLRVVVKLDADDTYAVELGRMRKPRGGSLPEYRVIKQVRGVYCDALGETVEEMCVEASR